RFFAFELRGRGESSAFLDMGDQFLALSQSSEDHKDGHRHFGLVVDDRAKLRRALEEHDVEILPGRGLDFLDPWGNRVQIVEYEGIQFTKTPQILEAMGLGDLEKSDDALKQLRDKGVDV
ncbi:MAG: VOC family protein, partial [Bradymonadaceae bacterium]